jgi:hypothetical protein
MTAKRPLLTDTTRMEQAVTDLTQLSEVIAHATAPSVSSRRRGRLRLHFDHPDDGIIDPVRSLNAIADDDTPRARLKADIPRLERRAWLMNNAIYLAVGSGICTTVLVILAFASAFLGIRHELVVGLLFVVALGLLVRRCSRLRVKCGSRSTSSTTSYEAPRICTKFRYAGVICRPSQGHQLAGQ